MAKRTSAGRPRKRHGLLKFIILAALVFSLAMLSKKLPDFVAGAEEAVGLFSDTDTGNYADCDSSQNNYTYVGEAGSPDTQEALYALAEEDSRVNDVIENISYYPEDLINLLLKNSEARDFVLNYQEHRDDTDVGEIASSELSGGIPHFMQWDERWGYFNYGSCVLGVTGCGPTCLSMVIVGLAGNKDATPAAVAKFSEQNGYYVEGDGTSWDLMTAGAESFGLVSVQVPLSEDSMTAELSSGHPIIISLGPGDFTDYGHFIVITSYENGMFTVNDPNSKKLSSEGWYFSTLAQQIRNIWAFSLS